MRGTRAPTGPAGLQRQPRRASGRSEAAGDGLVAGGSGPARRVSPARLLPGLPQSCDEVRVRQGGGQSEVQQRAWADAADLVRGGVEIIDVGPPDVAALAPLLLLHRCPLASGSC